MTLVVFFHFQYLWYWARVVVEPRDDDGEGDAWFSDWVEITADHRHLRTAAEYVNTQHS